MQSRLKWDNRGAGCHAGAASFGVVWGLTACLLGGASARAVCPTGPCTPANEATTCNDGLFCTQDVCNFGVCRCESYEPGTGGCDDGLYCDGLELCDEATDSCVPTQPPTCDPPLFCSNLFQDCVECETDVQCTTPSTPICNSSGVCVECTSSVECQDGSYCNGQESCDTGTGTCQAGTPINCPKVCFRGPTPGQGCSIDANCGAGGICVGFCSELRLECVQCEENPDCDNGRFCDGVEQCSNDNCVAGPATVCKKCLNNGQPCSTPAECPGSSCTGASSFCDEVSNQCVQCLIAADCDDLNYCTSNACVFNACSFNAKSSICESPEGLFCNGVEVCNHYLGNACSLNRNDASCCFHGTCLPLKTCTSSTQCLQAQGQTCVTGVCYPPMGCDSTAQCLAGQTCTNDTIPDCNDGFSCTADSCNETTNQCDNIAGNPACSDTFACTGTEVCDPDDENANATTGCLPGTPVDCSVFETFCAIGQCNNALGGQCQSVPRQGTVGVGCPDTNPCHIYSKCSGGLCQEVVPAANDPFRCGKLEFRPSSVPPVPVGATVKLEVWATALSCNNNPADTDPCRGSSVRASAIDAVLNWNQVRLELKPTAAADPNPLNPCKICSGGTTPGIFCSADTQCLGGGTCASQACVGGPMPGVGCTPGLKCVAGPTPGAACSGPAGTQSTCGSGGRCSTEGACNALICSGGPTPGAACTTVGTESNCGSGGFCVVSTTGACRNIDACTGCPVAGGYPWSAFGFFNDCGPGEDALNAPCSGTPANDGNAKFGALMPAFCSDGTTVAPPACVTPSGLHVFDVNVRAIAGGNGQVTLARCGGNNSTTGIGTPLPTTTTSNILNTTGSSVTITVTCDSHAVCNDQNPCTNDTCSCTTLGCAGTCSYVNNTNLCDDGLFCTAVDRCSGGSCLSTGTPCVPPAICNETTNQCVECLNNTQCADITLCTTDLCVNNFCQHNPISCDDGVACTVDTCDPETGLCAHTLNDALCDNSDFCAGEKCDSLAGCVFDHECISDDGNPCPDPTSCNGAANNCGTCLKPTVAANGGRYLTVTPGNQGGTPIALKVVGQCGDSEVGCVASYVQSKCEGGSNDGGTCDTNLQCPKTCYNDLVHSGASCAQTSECPLGDTCRGTCETGLLGAAPYYKTSAQWGTVQVRGVQIRPEKHYLVHTLCDLPPVTLSAAGEATTWVWGDSTGDGGVDALDISRIVDAFKGIFTSTTFQQVNLWGIGCIPDTTIDALDIVNDVDAFRHYPFPCGVTCP